MSAEFLSKKSAAASQDLRFECDVLVIGGGINGAGIARDAAGRGLSVLLCEKDDLAEHTSSASSKLIHGGLRYLEQYEFGLVRKALIEREILLRSAPHVIRPLRFVLPHDRGQRPAWMIRAGLFLYDRLARRELLAGSKGVNLRMHAAGVPLQAKFTHGFEYSDSWVDDARLVVLNAMDAAERGATILTGTRCKSARREADHWSAVLHMPDGKLASVRTRSLVNAAGPWATHFLRYGAQQPVAQTLRLIKGSHIVVRRLFDHPYAYIFQNSDRRIVFAIPYERDFTLIGTTDVDYQGDPGEVKIDNSEIDYLCGLVNHYFRRTVSAADVVWSYSGVRPLVEDKAADALEVTRDYRLEIDAEGAPLLSVFGGKLTTFRKLAEEAMDRLAPYFPQARQRWTANACLPGGDLFVELPDNRSVLEFDGFLHRMQAMYAWLAPALVERYVRAYGARIHALLAGHKALSDMGQEIMPGLYEAEVRYLWNHEWARNAADILWRRSKLGLHLPGGSEARLDDWMRSNLDVPMPIAYRISHVAQAQQHYSY